MISFVDAVRIPGEGHGPNAGVQSERPAPAFRAGINYTDCLRFNRPGDHVPAIRRYIDIVDLALYGDTLHVGESCGVDDIDGARRLSDPDVDIRAVPGDIHVVRVARSAESV